MSLNLYCTEKNEQETQLLQRSRAMFRGIEYFTK